MSFIKMRKVLLVENYRKKPSSNYFKAYKFKMTITKYVYDTQFEYSFKINT